MVVLIVCRGIQHSQLLLHRDEDAARSFCRERWACIGGQYHNNKCSFAVNLGVSKQRCAKFTSAHSNIWSALHPFLFLEQTAVRAAAAALVAVQFVNGNRLHSRIVIASRKSNHICHHKCTTAITFALDRIHACTCEMWLRPLEPNNCDS